MAELAQDVSDYRSSIQALSFGKRVGPYIYIHVDGIDELDGSFRALVKYVVTLAFDQKFEFNVIKAGIRQISLSLLNYPGFWRQAFPVLDCSASLDLGSHALKITDFKNRDNRPVLHRKELLLPPGHRHIKKFSSLTAQA